MRMRQLWRVAVTALVAVLASPVVGSAAATGYTVVDLGTLGGKGSMAEAVNAHGVVVGKSQTADGIWHAFMWDAAHGMVDLGDATMLTPLSLDDSGRVVATSGVGPVVWDAAGGWRPLPLRAGEHGNATAVDATGGVTGDVSVGGAASHAVRWPDETTAFVDLGSLGGGSSGSAVNRHGHVAGSYWTAAGVTRSFLWTSEAGMVDLGAFPDTPASGRVVAEGMNDADDVVGWETGPVAIRGFVYRDGALTDIGRLASRKGTSHVYPTDINNSGQIVGHTNGVAFVKNPGGPVTDLNTLLPRKSGWRLERATAINDAGQIVGFGGTPVGTRAFLLTPR